MTTSSAGGPLPLPLPLKPGESPEDVAKEAMSNWYAGPTLKKHVEMLTPYIKAFGDRRGEEERAKALEPLRAALDAFQKWGGYSQPWKKVRERVEYRSPVCEIAADGDLPVVLEDVPPLLADFIVAAYRLAAAPSGAGGASALPHDINGKLWIGYCDLCNGQHCLQVLAADAEIERSPHRAAAPSGDVSAPASMGYLSTLADMESVVIRAVGIFERAARGLIIPGQPIDQKRLAEDCESALRQLRPMLLTVRAFLDANGAPSGDAKGTR